MTTYIHYGSKHFDPNKFQPIKNIECFVKPEGGLWASNVASNYGWLILIQIWKILFALLYLKRLIYLQLQMLTN